MNNFVLCLFNIDDVIVVENSIEKIELLKIVNQDSNAIELKPTTAATSLLKTEKEMIETTDRIDDLQITNQTHDASSTNQESSSFSRETFTTLSDTQSSNNVTQGSSINKSSENNMVPISNEIYKIMQKQLEITQLDSNYNDANPRKDSPGKSILT